MSSADDIRAIVDPPLDLPEALKEVYSLAAESIFIAAEFCAMPERFELDPEPFRTWDRMLREAYDRLDGFVLSNEARFLAEAPDVFTALQEVREEADKVRTRLSSLAGVVLPVDPNQPAEAEEIAFRGRLRRQQLNLAHYFFDGVTVSAKPLLRLRLVLSVWAKEWAMQTPGRGVMVEQPPAPKHSALELIPGGFAMHGKPHILSGRPRAMLQALLEARHHRCTVDGLRKALEIDDEAVGYPEQVVKDTASTLRSALTTAAQEAGISWAKPLASTGRGEELTYILSLP
jgi:hypothetical protein